MIAQLDLNKLKLKFLTFDNRSLYVYYGEIIQKIAILRSDLKPFSNSHLEPNPYNHPNIQLDDDPFIKSYIDPDDGADV